MPKRMASFVVILFLAVIGASSCAAQNHVADPLNVELCVDPPRVAYRSLGRVQATAADDQLSALDNFRQAVGQVKQQAFESGANAILLDADVGDRWDIFVVSNVIYEPAQANPSRIQSVSGEAIVLERITQGGFSDGCVIGSARGPN